MRWIRTLLVSAVAAAIVSPAVGPAAEATIPVGVAKIDITPEEPVRMYGYASRKTESEGIAGRLHASALAFGGDEAEGPAVLLAVDNGSVPVAMRAEVFRRVNESVRIKAERFVLCNAHNHSGPDIKHAGSLPPEHREHIQQYARRLTDRLVQVVLDALKDRRPAHLAWARGEVGFAANRRVLKDGKWSGFGAVPDAPADHTLPVLRVTGADGKVMAVLLNYACHCTTLRGNFTKIHGDWAGCTQEYVEKDHPGAICLISIGCGADSDPCPHGTVELCEQHGRATAEEVKRLLAGPMKPIEPKLTCRMTTLEIPYQPPPSVEKLRERAKSSWSLQQVLDRIEKGEPLPKFQYPIATWTFGDDLAMVFLADEVVVDYASRLKRELDGPRLWISAYANDVSCYIVSKRLLGEGGYEVRNSLSSRVTFGEPDRLEPAMEDRIVEAAKSLLPAGFERR